MTEKTLEELLEIKKDLEDRIFCHEMGNDSYYSSPLRKEHQRLLRDLDVKIAEKKAKVLGENK